MFFTHVSQDTVLVLLAWSLAPNRGSRVWLMRGKVAEYLGDEVVIVATSTGAPLTVWLLKQLGVAKKVTAGTVDVSKLQNQKPFRLFINLAVVALLGPLAARSKP
jgi:hypothetical protein